MGSQYVPSHFISSYLNIQYTDHSLWKLRYTGEYVETFMLAQFPPHRPDASFIAVLIRDGTDVVTNKACASVSGNWVSPYDGVPTTLASDLDIVRVFSKRMSLSELTCLFQDHLVPLKEVSLF